MRHSLTGHIQILKYFNDLQNWNFSVFRLKCNQTMEIKQNQSFFHGTSSNLTQIFFNKNVKVLQWLSKSMEMKQNHTFLHEKYSNLT